MRWTPALMMMFLILVVGSCALDGPASRAASLAANERATATTDASATPTPLHSMRPESPLRPPVDEWTTYTSESGGYTLEHPAGWSIDESQIAFGHTGIVPPVRKAVDSIGIYFEGYTKPEEESLLDWYHRYLEMSLHLNASDYHYEIVSLNKLHISNVTEALYGYLPDALFGRKYVLTNGRLVVQLSTNGISAQQESVLRRVAESFQFSDDETQSLADIIDPRYLHSATTIEEYERQEQIGRDGLAALNVRMRTGETPHDMLTDPEVAAEYGELLERNARDIEMQDEFREMIAKLTAEPMPTQEPTQLAMTKEAIQVMEDRYIEMLAAERTQEASRPAQPTSPVIPTPTPTFTPIPERVLKDTVEQFPGMQPYVAASEYGPQIYDMLIWFDPDIWELEFNSRGGYLSMIDDPKCRLYLYLSVFEAFPISAEWLANREWTVYDFGGYSASTQLETYHAIVSLPEGQEYRETNKGQCQLLAEDVLDTASSVPSSTIE